MFKYWLFTHRWIFFSIPQQISFAFNIKIKIVFFNRIAFFFLKLNLFLKLSSFSELNLVFEWNFFSKFNLVFKWNFFSNWIFISNGIYFSNWVIFSRNFFLNLRRQKKEIVYFCYRIKTVWWNCLASKKQKIVVGTRETGISLFFCIKTISRYIFNACMLFVICNVSRLPDKSTFTSSLENVYNKK